MISVCIPTFNGEKYIEEQLKSILNQLDFKDEIIISDDHSTDRTIEIVNSFNDSRIKIYENKKRNHYFKFMYTTCNIENALKYSVGDFIYLADQDDIWMENKVSVIQSLFESYDVVLSDCSIIDENSKIISESYFEINKSQKGFVKNIISNSYLGCCMAFNRKVLFKVIPISRFTVPHDIWIGLISETYYRVCFEPTKLVKYRRHGENLSSSGEVSTNSLIYKIHYRLILFVAIFVRIIKIWIKKNLFYKL